MISTKKLLFFCCVPYVYKEERHYFHPKRSFLISQTHVPSYHYKTLTKKYVDFLIFDLISIFFQPSKCVCSLVDHDFSGPSYCLYEICLLNESPVIGDRRSYPIDNGEDRAWTRVPMKCTDSRSLGSLSVGECYYCLYIQ